MNRVKLKINVLQYNIPKISWVLWRLACEIDTPSKHLYTMQYAVGSLANLVSNLSNTDNNKHLILSLSTDLYRHETSFAILT